jgi:hypothetical protein
MVKQKMGSPMEKKQQKEEQSMSRIGKYETTGHTGMLYSANPD